MDLVGFNDVETTLPGAGPPLPLEPASSSTLALLCEEDLNASSWVTHFPVLPDYFNNNWSEGKINPQIHLQTTHTNKKMFGKWNKF